MSGRRPGVVARCRTLAACVVATAAASEAACPPADERDAIVAETAAADPRDPAPWTRRLEVARLCADLRDEAAARQGRAEATMRAGRGLEAIDDLEALAASARRLADPALEATARERLARVHVAGGRPTEARTELLAALTARATVDDPLATARIHSELARIARRTGDYVEALRHEQRALSLRRQLDPPREVSTSLLGLAVLYEQIERFGESRRHYEEALAEAERNGSPGERSAALLGFAGFLNDFGHTEAARALALAQRALELERALGDGVATGSVELQVGRALGALGDDAGAMAAFARAEAIADRAGARALAAHVAYRRGERHLAAGRLDSALADIEAARRLYEAQDNHHRLAKVHGTLERLHTARGDALAAALSGREHFRLRNALLGADASGKFGEILSNFALGEARHRTEIAERERELEALRAQRERERVRLALWLVAALLSVLLVLAWRHLGTRRLMAMLRANQRALERAHGELALRSEALWRVSITDSLTGLASRAHGLDRLRAMLGDHAETGRSPAVLVVDLDHFKQINDRHGHLVGDEALRLAAAAIGAGLASGDFAARLGGEEFLVVLADVGRGDLAFQAELLRRRIEQVELRSDTAVVHLSASIGACWVRDLPDPTVTGVLRVADAALYEAKHAGRNRVVVHGARPATDGARSGRTDGS